MALNAWPAEFVVDMSASRDPSCFFNSGLPIKPIAGYPPGTGYTFSNVDVHWVFPEGIEFKQNVDIADFNVADNRLTSGFSGSDRIMPLEDAFLIMKAFIAKFKPEQRQLTEQKRLQNWYENQSKKERGDHIEQFGCGVVSRKTGINVGLVVRASMNLSYPVVINIDYGWISEGKINPDAQPLDLATGIMDLNPLGGKVYDRSESANPSGRKADPIFDAWLGGDTSKMPDFQKVLEERSSSAKKAERQVAAEPEPASNYYLLLAVVSLAAIFWWMYKKYHDARKAT